MSSFTKIFENIPSIIPSMDVRLGDLSKIMDKICGLQHEIGGIKIGSLLAWEHGLPKIVKDIRDTSNSPIIFDAQKAGTDIPSIVEEQVKIVADVGIDAFIAAPLGSGPKTLEAFVKTSLDCQITPIIVLEMTHPMANDFLIKEAGMRVLIQSLEMGVEYFVAPANNPDRITYYRNLASENGKGIRIFSPGVGPQGGGPDTAIKAGADFVIIGRNIYEAADPRAEVVRIYKLISIAYRDRSNAI